MHPNSTMPEVKGDQSVTLLLKAQAGDDEALNQLLARYWPRLQRWASRRLTWNLRTMLETGDLVQEVRTLTEGRGADAVLLAVGGNSLIPTAMDSVRYGGRVMLFAQTARGEASIDPAAICVDEKTLLGSYSASVELQDESARLVFNREIDLESLISHRFPLRGAVEALHLAANPKPDSMKIVIQPGLTTVAQ